MESNLNLLGTWASHADDPNSTSDSPACVCHFVDDQTYVLLHRGEMGLLITWFQYWPAEGGILSYPLSQGSRVMFKTAVYAPIIRESDHLLVNGQRFDQVSGIPLPERCDHFPGTRPDEHGRPVPHTFKGKLLDHLSLPPLADSTDAPHAPASASDRA